MSMYLFGINASSQIGCGCDLDHDIGHFVLSGPRGSFLYLIFHVFLDWSFVKRCVNSQLRYIVTMMRKIYSSGATWTVVFWVLLMNQTMRKVTGVILFISCRPDSQPAVLLSNSVLGKFSVYNTCTLVCNRVSLFERMRPTLTYVFIVLIPMKKWSNTQRGRTVRKTVQRINTCGKLYANDCCVQQNHAKRYTTALQKLGASAWATPTQITPQLGQTEK